MATTSFDTETDEIARAEERVRLSKAELSKSLRQVGKSGENLARQLGDELKPTLAVAAAAVGAAVVVGVAVALVRRSRRHNNWLAPEQPSALGAVAKTAGLWALRFLARRVAQEVVSRLTEGAAVQTPAPAAE
jgi:hypothetical protein